MTEHANSFPIYTDSELALDRYVHLVGVPTAIVTAVILVGEADAIGDQRLIATLTLYGVALVATLALSAAYNMSMPGPLKERLRRYDRSMIFVMIAASYTPYALNALDPGTGIALCVVAWVLAAVGISVELTFPRRYEREIMGLYLCNSWMLLGLFPTFMERVPAQALTLLLAGGVVLSAGAYIQSRHEMQYHNAIWHLLVLFGAGLHVHALRAAFLAGA